MLDQAVIPIVSPLVSQQQKVGTHRILRVHLLKLLRERCALARGGLDAVGFVRSPFSIDGKQRLFAEPPHMQASMLFLPHGAHVPAVGDEVDVRVRYTATAFDQVLIN